MSHPDALDRLSRRCEAPGCDEYATKCVQERLTVYPPIDLPTVRTRFYCAAHHAQVRAAFRAAFFGLDQQEDREHGPDE